MAHDWISKKFIDRAKLNVCYAPNPKFSFGWWFGQYWSEAVGAGGRNDPGDANMKLLLSLVYAHLFPNVPPNANPGQKRALGDAQVANIAQLPQPADVLARSAHYRQILKLALDLGSIGMPTKTVAETAVTDPLVPKDQRARQLLKLRLNYILNGTAVQVAIGYRGEGRPFDTVVKHKGVLNRIDLLKNPSMDPEIKKLKDDLKKLNVHQPWHPFSDATSDAATKLYARIGKGDNCLLTVTSIGRGLAVPVGFPLIEDEELMTFPDKPLADWKFSDFRALNGVKLARVDATINGRQRPAVFLATDNYVYAAKFTGGGLVNTQDYVETNLGAQQGNCKERGVREVPLHDLLAGVHLQRIHLGPTRTWGVVGFIREKKYMVDGKWANSLNMNDFARYHFHGNVPAASNAIGLLSKMLNGKANSGILTGEKIDGPPEPTGMTLNAVDFGITYPQFNALRERFGNDLYYGATQA